MRVYTRGQYERVRKGADTHGDRNARDESAANHRHMPRHRVHKWRASAVDPGHTRYIGSTGWHRGSLNMQNRIGGRIRSRYVVPAPDCKTHAKHLGRLDVILRRYFFFLKLIGKDTMQKYGKIYNLFYKVLTLFSKNKSRFLIKYFLLDIYYVFYKCLCIFFNYF